MWRATVIAKLANYRLMLTVPDLYGNSPVGPVTSAVDAEVDDRVVVADLRPAAHVHDWWVVGYESEVGRWGNPYPHTHPIGQIDGLTEALASASASSGSGAWTKLTTAATWADRPAGLGYSTGLYGRTTPAGAQLRMAVAPTTATGYSLTVATLDTTYRPSWTVIVPVQLLAGGSWATTSMQITSGGAMNLLGWSNATGVTELHLSAVLPRSS